MKARPRPLDSSSQRRKRRSILADSTRARQSRPSPGSASKGGRGHLAAWQPGDDGPCGLLTDSRFADGLRGDGGSNRAIQYTRQSTFRETVRYNHAPTPRVAERTVGRERRRERSQPRRHGLETIFPDGDLRSMFALGARDAPRWKLGATPIRPPAQPTVKLDVWRAFYRFLLLPSTQHGLAHFSPRG